MENLVITSKNGSNVTTSFLVAETFGRRHDNVIRDIENLHCSANFRTANFEETPYIHPQNGQVYPSYEITKDGFSFLVMGYTGAKAGEFKEKFINEFNKREAMLKSDDYIIERAMAVLASRTKLLEAQLEARSTQLQLQESVIKESAPKVMYFDDVLQSETLITTNVIAKELGMSAITLNKILHENKVIYRSGETLVLYHNYQNKEYIGTKTHIFKDSHGNERTNILTVWTEKGRNFIHDLIGKIRAKAS